MYNCKLTDNAASTFVDCLHSDRGPIQLDVCQIDSQILANALTGNSRATHLRPHVSRGTNHADTAALLTGLANNKSLLVLDLRHRPISDGNWIILCQSLRAHPTLTSLKLAYTRFGGLNDEQRVQRTRELAEMTKGNKSLHTIELLEGRHDQQIYAERIYPYLETNRYRPRVLAVIEIEDRPVRQQVLGRALYCVRSNPNLFSMFLLENVDAFVRSEQE
jgi:hypothetical protein